MSESLKNRGVTIIGDPRPKRSPVVVIGTARGGTSMVAGTLAKLGVFMGELARAPVYEDLRLAEAIERGNMSLAAEIVKIYDAEHSHWGWKRPSAVKSIEMLDGLFNEPIYIFIFKDILTVAHRNSISMHQELLVGMDKALRDYRKILRYLQKTTSQCMLVSYDKALSNPEYFVGMIVKFCGLTPDPIQLEQASEFIRPDPIDYLDITRISKAQGRIDCVKGRVVFGWARYVHSVKPVTVSFYAGDELIGETIADKAREDISRRLGASCAFEFLLPEGILSSRGVALRARAANEVNDLDNSPLVLGS